MTSEVSGWLNDDKPLLKSARGMKGGVEAITTERPCRAGLLCLETAVHMYGMGGASGIGWFATLVMDYTTGEVKTIRDFVEPAELRLLARKTAWALTAHGDLYDTPKVDATYKQFAVFIPTEGGFRLYFPEYEFGWQRIAVDVIWPLSESRV